MRHDGKQKLKRDVYGHKFRLVPHGVVLEQELLIRYARECKNSGHTIAKIKLTEINKHNGDQELLKGPNGNRYVVCIYSHAIKRQFYDHSPDEVLCRR